MANVRYLVNDVDAALAFYVDALGFALVERWGPPFAMVRRDDLTLWLSGPGGRQILVEDPSGNPVELFQQEEK
jgi:catechol 2,3-dioxygenase-like lactoylglutathione lyase family enzyme